MSTITMPSEPVAPASFEFQKTAIVASSTNPFTGQQQLQSWNAGYMEASVSMPQMAKTTAQAWITFIEDLNGSANVFQFPDAVCALFPAELYSSGTTARYWRLKNNQAKWSIKEGAIYSVTFEIREVL